jgi:predicted nucleic-acid-binding protein
MIGIDANVLVRYLVQDDPKQAQVATRFFEADDYRKQGFYLTDIVLCELVWVLESAFRIRRSEVAITLDRVLRTESFYFDHKDELWDAIRDYRNGKADFADYLICRLNESADCNETVTFDRDLRDGRKLRLLG